MIQYTDTQYNRTDILPELNSWDFIEQFYPQYSSSNEILCLNDLSQFLTHEITYSALLERQKWVDKMYPETIQREYDSLFKKAQIKALENFYTIARSDGRLKLVSVCNPRHNEQVPYIPLENVSVHEREMQHIPYRWVNEKKEPDPDGEIFEVFYRNKWREAQSIDFEF